MKQLDRVVPNGKQFDNVHNSYISLVTEGKVDKENSKILIFVSRTLIDRDAGVVVLQGTD